MSEFKGDLFRMARIARDITQEVMAVKLDVTQGKISKWEDGLLFPSDLEIARIAKELQFPESFFTSDGTLAGFGSGCIYHRKRNSLPVRTLSMLHARMNIIAMGVERMLRNGKIDGEIEFHRMDVDEYGSAQRVAQLLRTHWRVPPGPVPNLVHFVEAAGGIVIPFHTGTDKLDAVSVWMKNTVPLFFINADAPADRWRFNLAHEVAHLVMHTVPSPTAEDEADDFAGELLIPAREAQHELSGLTLQKAARLKLRWRTSMQAIIMQARKIGAISPTRCKLLFIEISKSGQRKVERVQIEAEEPKTLKKLIDLHKTRLKYSDEQLAALTYCTDTTQFEARFGGGANASASRLKVHK